MSHMKKIIAIAAIFIFAFLFCLGCSAGAQPIQGTDRDAVLGYAEPKTDNLLDGFNSGDYAVFSRDFDAAMRQAETESVFLQTRAAIQSKIGNYISRQVADVVKQDNFIVVIYNGRFEKENGVTMRLVFTPDDAHQIAGLWFDSPMLRQK